MAKLKQTLRYGIAFLLLLTPAASCRDAGNGGGPTDEAVVTCVADLTPYEERAGEYDNRIDAIDVLMFDAVSGEFARRVAAESLVISGNTAEFRMKLPYGEWDLYAVAGMGDELAWAELEGRQKEEIFSQSKVEMPGSGVWDTSRAIPMFGEMGRVTVPGETDGFDLTRMMARVDVGVAAENFRLTSVYVYNYRRTGYVVPGQGIDPWPAPRPVSYETEGGSAGQIYLFEAENHSDAEHIVPVEPLQRVCVVVGGYFEDDLEPGYYRLDFSNTVDDEEVFLDVERNHLYMFNINSVAASGARSPEEAFSATTEIGVNVAWQLFEIYYDIPPDRQFEFSVGELEEFPAAGDTQTLEVTSTVEWTIASVDDGGEGWLAVRIVDDGAEVVCGANESGGPRSGSFAIRAGNLLKTILVTQAGE